MKLKAGDWVQMKRLRPYTVAEITEISPDYICYSIGGNYKCRVARAFEAGTFRKLSKIEGAFYNSTKRNSS